MNATDLTRHADRLRAACPPAENPTARDWAAFFSALAEFAAVVIPLIIQFFQEQDQT